MRIVFVSHVPPDDRSVGGLRLWRFAQELTKQGHHILFVTGGKDESGLRDRTTLIGALQGYNWSEPLLLSCGASGTGMRSGIERLKVRYRAVQKGATALAIIFRGGAFWRWRIEAERVLMEAATHFRPQLVYATFGNLDALNIAQRLARRHGIPWVMDVKDPFSTFLHRSLWWLPRYRYSDAACVTYNAQFQRDESLRLGLPHGEVIYSGADVPATRTEHRGSRARQGRPVYNLIGSIYSDEVARDFLRAFIEFVTKQRDCGAMTPQMHYIGADHGRVKAQLALLPPQTCITVCEPCPRMELLAQCQHAAANCYIAADHTFHHKLFELLAAERPVIVYPDEREEARRVAIELGAPLWVCRSSEELIAAWRDASEAESGATKGRIGAGLSWSRFAGDLEGVFKGVLATHGGAVRQLGKD